MADRETGTVWAHLTGEALAGPLAGRRLLPLPVTMTSFGAWLDLHPDSLAPACPSRTAGRRDAQLHRVARDRVVCVGRVPPGYRDFVSRLPVRRPRSRAGTVTERVLIDALSSPFDDERGFDAARRVLGSE